MFRVYYLTIIIIKPAHHNPSVSDTLHGSAYIHVDVIHTCVSMLPLTCTMRHIYVFSFIFIYKLTLIDFFSLQNHLLYNASVIQNNSFC